jgi:hypothetical protein
MKPEEQTEIILWDWLRNNAKVYFNRKNKLGIKVFKVKGIKKLPDLIIKIEDYYGVKYYAIEVKDNSSSINILGGSKIVDLYFKNYIEKKTEYFIEDKKINIDGFLIASQSSPLGYLFKDEKIIDNWNEPEKKSKYAASKEYKIIPRKEGNRTFEFIRFLWNIYGKIRKDYEEKCDIGILIGNSEDNFSPYIMITHYDNIKKRWGQRFWKL